MAKSNIPTLPLKLAKNIEPETSWDKIQSPQDLINLVAKLLFVDVTQISALEEVIISPTEPAGVDRKKIWLRTEQPFSFNILSGNQYISFYQYTPNVALLWATGKDTLPPYMRRVTEAELEKMGITTPTDSYYFYVIFEP